MFVEFTVSTPVIYEDQTEKPDPVYERFLIKNHNRLNICNHCKTICSYRKLTDNIKISCTACNHYEGASC